MARRFESLCRKAAKDGDVDSVVIELMTPLEWRNDCGCSGVHCVWRRVETRFYRVGEPERKPVEEIVRGLCAYRGACVLALR